MKDKPNSVAGWILLATVALSIGFAPRLVEDSPALHGWKGTAVLIFILIACVCSYKWLSKKH